MILHTFDDTKNICNTTRPTLSMLCAVHLLVEAVNHYLQLQMKATADHKECVADSSCYRNQFTKSTVMLQAKVDCSVTEDGSRGTVSLRHTVQAVDLASFRWNAVIELHPNSSKTGCTIQCAQCCRWQTRLTCMLSRISANLACNLKGSNTSCRCSRAYTISGLCLKPESRFVIECLYTCRYVM